MKTLGVIAQKGGAGKTTLCIHLAVRAGAEGLRVLMVDTDPQASATAWWRRRRAETPALIQSSGDVLDQVLETAGQQGYDLVVIDTAPHDSHDASICARLSDRVYIPTRPAILDLDAIGATTELVSQVGTAARIVLNSCPPPGALYGQPRKVTEAREAQRSYGLPVSGVAISQRAAFSHALIDGRAVMEFEQRGKAAREIDRLWALLREDLQL